MSTPVIFVGNAVEDQDPDEGDVHQGRNPIVGHRLTPHEMIIDESEKQILGQI